MEILTIVASSALVSGLVTIILGHIFENKRYIKDKKIAVYFEFLEQLDRIIPNEIMLPGHDLKKMKDSLAVESSALEKYLWKIELITESSKVKECAKELFNTYSDLSNHVVPEKSLPRTTEDVAKLKGFISKINRSREKLVCVMNIDINKFF